MKIPAPIGPVTRAAPWLIFLLLMSLTGLVWRQQVHHQRSQVHRHTVDVTMQAARRLEIYVKSRLTIATIFTNHWAAHEDASFPRETFQEFGAVLRNAVPGCHLIQFIPRSGGHGWQVPATAGSPFSAADPAYRDILLRSRDRGMPVLSGPLRTNTGQRAFFAAMPVRRDAQFLGWIVVKFRMRSLVDDCFLERIRREFRFQIQDGGELLYRYPPDSSANAFTGSIRASRSFLLQNRRWRLSMTPRAVVGESSGWLANLWVFVFGLLLSAGISLLFGALLRRMRLFRQARDETLRELKERQRAEAELRTSEARYRSVFDSASDGLIMFGDDGVIIEANPAACRMHGYRVGALDGRPVPELIAPDHQWRYDDFMQQIEDGGPVQIDSVNIRADGTPIDVEVRGARFNIEGKQRVLALLADVTLHRQAMARQAQLARQVLTAQEEERARVSRDLHDELGQILTAMRLEMDLKRKGPNTRASEFDYATELLEKATEELRRICRGLRPPLLDDLGGVAALHHLVTEFQEHSDIETVLQTDPPDESWELPDELALTLYRVLQEALTNVRRHSGASTVDISLALRPTAIVLTVTDDGKGFELTRIGQHGAGLAGMRERAGLVGGNVDVRSVPAEGTRIELRLPRLDAERERKS